MIIKEHRSFWLLSNNRCYPLVNHFFTQHLGKNICLLRRALNGFKHLKWITATGCTCSGWLDPIIEWAEPLCQKWSWAIVLTPQAVPNRSLGIISSTKFWPPPPPGWVWQAQPCIMACWESRPLGDGVGSLLRHTGRVGQYRRCCA